MKYIPLTIFWMFLSLISYATDNLITSYHPDSLKTFQLRLNLDNSLFDKKDDLKSTYYRLEDTRPFDSYNDSEIRKNYGSTISLNGDYKQLLLKRETSIYFLGYYTLLRYNPIIQEHRYIFYDSESENETYEKTKTLFTIKRYATIFGFEHNNYFKYHLGLRLNFKIHTYGHHYNGRDEHLFQKVKRYFNNEKEDSLLAYQMETSQNSYQYRKSYVTLAPGISLGRIYQGKYAAKSLEIIEELRKDGYLKRELTDFEFKKLSQIILQQKEGFYYDVRIHRKESLERIYRFLIQRGIVDSSSHGSFLNVLDIYSFAPFLNRNFGNRLLFSLYTRQGYVKFTREQKPTTIEDGPDNQLETTERNIYFKQNERSKSLYFRTSLNHANVINWHFWYNINLEVSYPIYSHIEYELTRRTVEFTPDSTHLSESFNSLEITETEKYVKLTLLGQYQFTSRSLLTLPLYFKYLESKVKKDYQPSQTSRDNRTVPDILINCSPKLTYFFTPKMSTSIQIDAISQRYKTKIYSQPFTSYRIRKFWKNYVIIKGNINWYLW